MRRALIILLLVIVAAQAYSSTQPLLYFTCTDKPFRRCEVRILVNEKEYAAKVPMVKVCDLKRA